MRVLLSLREWGLSAWLPILCLLLLASALVQPLPAAASGPKRLDPQSMQLRMLGRLADAPAGAVRSYGAHLLAGTPVTTLALDGDWMKIAAGTSEGWVPARLVEPEGSCLRSGEQQFDFLASHFGLIAADERFAASGLRMAATRGITAGHRSHSMRSLLQGLNRYPPDTALLVFYYGASATCTLVIDRFGIAAYAVNRSLGAERLEAEVGRLLETLVPPACLMTRASTKLGDDDARAARAPTVCRHHQRDVGTDQAAADAFSRLLVPQQVEGALISRRVRNLIVVPYGHLALVPFGALRLPTESVDLVERFAITLAPAFTQIGIGKGLHLARRDAARHPTGIVVGNPSYADREFRLGNLAGAENEAREVAALLGVEPLIGYDATHASLSRQIAATGSGTVDVLYLATHGIATRNDPLAALEAPHEESFLALANGDRLSAATMATTGFAGARLVVLSACVTGRGWISEAGSVGLPRLFHLNGADEVVMSLWQVDDAATSALMTAFMRNYLKAWPQASAATALRAASLEIRKRYPRPAFWAPFSVFGVGPF